MPQVVVDRTRSAPCAAQFSLCKVCIAFGTLTIVDTYTYIQPTSVPCKGGPISINHP